MKKIHTQVHSNVKARGVCASTMNVWHFFPPCCHHHRLALSNQREGMRHTPLIFALSDLEGEHRDTEKTLESAVSRTARTKIDRKAAKEGVRRKEKWERRQLS